MAELKVKIGAQLEGLRTGIAQAAGIVKQSTAQMSAASEMAQKSFTVLNQTKFTFGENYASASKKLASEASRTAAILGGSMKKGSNEAAFALTNLGRVAQDAPFGFIGIQNNLNPLLESFQRLKTTTGSTGGALKALTGSLMGPAGLGIALSVVTAGIMFYTQWKQKQKKATDDVKKSTEDYIQTLSQVNQVQLVGGQNAQKELTTLDLLYKTYQNSNLPLKQRKEAYQEIQKQYPDYFGNIKFEREASDKTKTAYDNLTGSILATGRARAAVDLITKNSSKQLEVEQKMVDLQAERLAAQIKLNQARKDGSSLTANNTESLIALGATKQLKGQIIEIDKQIYSLASDRNKLTENNLRLEKSVTAEIAKGGKIAGNVGGDAISVAKPKVDNRKTLNWWDKENKTSPVMIGEQFKKSAEITGEAASLFEDAISRAESATENLDLSIVSQELADFNESVANTLETGVESMLGGIGESIAGLMSGTMSMADVGGMLLGVIGGIATQLGKAAIGIGVGMMAIKKAFSNPFTAIAAGVALIAIGALISNAAKIPEGGGSAGAVDSQYNVPGFANGVKNFRGGVALVGERGPELVNLPTGSDVIPNHKMASFMGGGGSQVIIPEVIIKGQDLRLVFNRATRDRG